MSDDENSAKPNRKLRGRGTILEGQHGLNEEDAGRRWMDGHRQGVDEEKRIFADEVTNLHQAHCRLDDGKKGPAQGAAWFEFSSCYELRNHRLCR